MTVDSGAVDTVSPPGCFPAPVEQNIATRTGFNYYGPDGTVIPHLGEQVIRGTTSLGESISLVTQVAAITKPLLAVNKFARQGNKVVFEGEGGYIENSNGQRTEIKLVNGDYQIEVWVHHGSGQGNWDTERATQLAAVTNEGQQTGAPL